MWIGLELGRECAAPNSNSIFHNPPIVLLYVLLSLVPYQSMVRTAKVCSFLQSHVSISALLWGNDYQRQDDLSSIDMTVEFSATP